MAQVIEISLCCFTRRAWFEWFGKERAQIILMACLMQLMTMKRNASFAGSFKIQAFCPSCPVEAYVRLPDHADEADQSRAEQSKAGQQRQAVSEEER